MDLNPTYTRELAARALAEDIGSGDLTTLAAIPADAQVKARFVLREDGVCAGMPIVAAVLAQVDPNLQLQIPIAEGHTCPAGTTLAEVSGAARSILSAERVALNLLQRACGIASLTAQYVQAIAGTRARILDTRKTTPGLRILEKYAVRVGGGTNHRFGLYDGVMLKDNHLAILATQGIDLTKAIRTTRARVGPMVRIEVEVETVADAGIAAEAGADMILLDNMTPADLRASVERIAGRAQTEASGGITLANVRAAAESGVDFISIGALTHSARALDIGLDIADV
jgi:nicotinate-nucleotide pyrophosphorylase (carboxylating)